MVFTIALTDVQQQKARFPLETHALLPHGSDCITFVMSRIATLLLEVFFVFFFFFFFFFTSDQIK